ncbi:hypothetical protein LINPERPRIM_LOCUS38303 [Linum perenne]
MLVVYMTCLDECVVFDSFVRRIKIISSKLTTIYPGREDYREHP